MGEQMAVSTRELIERLRAGEIPKAGALRAAGDVVTLAQDGNAPDAKTVKVAIKARQRGPINHWYWGTVWHDLSTMRSRSKIALDDTHDLEIGYGRPLQTGYGLEVEGVVIENPQPDHPANRIIWNLRNGIPQEASIDFGGEYDVVEIPEGLSMPVNGLQAVGPCIVIQNWPLRAVAICKEGADGSTETSTTYSNADGKPPRTITRWENTMSPQPTQSTAPATQQATVEPAITGEVAPAQAVPAEPPAAAPEGATQQAAPVDARQGKPEPEPLTDAEKLATENAELTKQLAELEQKLAALTAGAAPVPGVATESKPEPATWNEAVAIVQRDHPSWAAWQCHVEAQKRFPALLARINTRKVG